MKEVETESRSRVGGGVYGGRYPHSPKLDVVGCEDPENFPEDGHCMYGFRGPVIDPCSDCGVIGSNSDVVVAPSRSPQN